MGQGKDSIDKGDVREILPAEKGGPVLRVGVLFMGVLRFALTLIPLRLSLSLSERLGAFSAVFFRRERLIAEEQLKYAASFLESRGEGSGSEALRDAEIVRRNFGHFGRVAAESLLLEKFLPPPAGTAGTSQVGRVRTIGLEHTKAAANGERSAVFLSAHIGSFELLSAYHAAIGMKFLVIGRVPNQPAFAAMIQRLRKGYGSEIVWRDDPRAAAKLIQGIRENIPIAVLIDQDTRLPSVFSPFFGLEAAYPQAPLRLALRFSLPVFTSFIVRESPLEHCIITEPILYDSKDPQAVDRLLEQFGRRLEDLIVKYPEQWPWWHRRWRRRPDVDYSEHPEELRSTSSYLKWLNQETDKLARV